MENVLLAIAVMKMVNVVNHQLIALFPKDVVPSIVYVGHQKNVANIMVNVHLVIAAVKMVNVV